MQDCKYSGWRFLCFSPLSSFRGGVSTGLEVGNKIMMPLLFALLIALLICALQTRGAATGLDFLLRPQWQKIGPTAVLEALGQALFSLSLGMGDDDYLW